MALPRDLFWLQNLVDCGVPLKMDSLVPSHVAGITALKGDVHVPSESHLRPLDRSRVPLWTGTWTTRLTAQLFKKAPSSAFCTRDSDKSACKNAFNQ